MATTSASLRPRGRASASCRALGPAGRRASVLFGGRAARVACGGGGVGVLGPTGAEVEESAREVGDRWKQLATAFYHGGEPIRVIRPFLDAQVSRPFLLAMTAAGQSALNIPGLDTVIIYDARYTNVVERGRNVLTRLYLGANEMLQMAGRVHGRVPPREVYILCDRA